MNKEEFLKVLLDNTWTDKNGCMNWCGLLTSKGYARITGCPLGERVHRVVMKLLGEVPNDMLVCHTCDNRKCINPKHLYVGTFSQNNKDTHVRGRMPCLGRRAAK